MPNLDPNCYCGAPMRLKETSKYTTKDGKPKKFWGCTRYPECKGIVGAHPDGTPLGFPADAETKQLRHVVHQILNRFWNYNKPRERAEMYAFLEKNFPPGHLGQMNKDQLLKLKASLEGRG